MARRRRIWWLVAVGYVVALATLVFAPVAHALNRFTVKLYVLWIYHLRWPGQPLPETFGTALNVLLFVPAGLLVVLLTRLRWWSATLALIAVSAAIEAAQALLLTGREASVGDVVANGCGALAGAFAGELIAAARRGRADG